MPLCLPMQRPDGTFDSVPDPGLDEQYEYIRLLGYGGTGQTLLYRNRRTDELAAIKLIKRPLPEIIQQRLLREFTVCALCKTARSVSHNALSRDSVCAQTTLDNIWEPCECATRLMHAVTLSLNP